MKEAMVIIRCGHCGWQYISRESAMLTTTPQCGKCREPIRLMDLRRVDGNIILLRCGRRRRKAFASA
jgi:predicted transcriptional regulator